MGYNDPSRSGFSDIAPANGNFDDRGAYGIDSRSHISVGYTAPSSSYGPSGAGYGSAGGNYVTGSGGTYGSSGGYGDNYGSGAVGGGRSGAYDNSYTPLSQRGGG